MIYNKGDIVVIPVPFTDNKNRKIRPAVVVSNDIVHKTGDVIIVQITSQLKNDGLSMSLDDSDMTVPLQKKSYIRVHKIFVMEEKYILKKVSKLNKKAYKHLSESINNIIGIE